MVAIMSANETSDLASGSHFLVNTTGVSNIYSSVIEEQWAGVTYSCLVPTQSWQFFSLTWNTYYTILFSVCTSYMNSFSLIYVRKRYNSYRCFQFRSQSELFEIFFSFGELIVVKLKSTDVLFSSRNKWWLMSRSSAWTWDPRSRV